MLATETMSTTTTMIVDTSTIEKPRYDDYGETTLYADHLSNDFLTSNEPLLSPIGSDIYITRFRKHKYPEVWEMYVVMITCFWTWPEVDMETDGRHWREQLKDNERQFLKLVFAFFTFGDGIVIENLVRNFKHEVQDQDVRFVYSVIEFFETIHATTYAMILDTLVNSDKEMEELENMFKTDESFKELTRWCEEYMDREKHSFAESLLAFACFEGIIFSGAFCCLFWFKPKGLMPGVTFSNELISRDEGLHCDFACLLYNLLQYPLSYEKAVEIIKSSVHVGTIFATRVVPCDLLGINSALMIEYLEFIANRLFGCLRVYAGCFKPYPMARNPFDWMELISLQGKTNFFERRVGEYSNAAMTSFLNSPSNIKRSTGSINRSSGNIKKSIEENSSEEEKQQQRSQTAKYDPETWDDNVFTTEADF